MKTASFLRALLVLAALVAVGSTLTARSAQAQRSASIRVSATVVSAYAASGLVAAEAPATAAVPAQHLQRVPVAGAGVLEVTGMAGAKVTVSLAGRTEAAGEPASPVVRATIAFPGV